ncbi:MAG: M4 family metallopeptidase, partial [Pseudomonadales bacterium]
MNKNKLTTYGLVCLAFLHGCGGGGGGGGGGGNAGGGGAVPTLSANAGIDVTRAVGDSITLAGSGTDASGAAVSSCRWAYRKIGIQDPDLPLGDASRCSLSFTAPAHSGRYIFRLTVTDSAGATATDETALNIYYQLQRTSEISFTFTTAADTLYEISMQQEPCPRGLCCSLITDRNDRLLGETVPDPATNMARLLFEPQTPGTATVTVAGLNECRFYTPARIDATVAAARGQVAVSGQTPDPGTSNPPTRYDNLDVTNLGQRVYLHDTSRRNNGLAADAAITTVKFVPNTAERGEYRFIVHQAANAASLDKSAVDAHGYTLNMYDYLKQAFNFNSYDNAGISMVAVTDLDFPFETTEFCNTPYPPGTLWNAFWNPYERYIAFTKGFPDNPNQRDLPASVALDVVAHEWGHAVTNEFTNLEYERESGALNEAFSDWIGAAAEHHVQGSRANWLMGEAARPVRSMSNPTDYGDPDTYKDQYWHPTDTESCAVPKFCENDFCGVHSNSGVGNKMFYLLSQ